jgi:hypothetical protein
MDVVVVLKLSWQNLRTVNDWTRCDGRSKEEGGGK